MAKFILGLTACSLILGFVYKILYITPNVMQHEETGNATERYGVTIKNTTLVGTDERNRRYNIVSKTTHKSNDDSYHMQDLKMLYDLGKQKLHMTSQHGLMDDASQILKLKDNVVMIYDGFLLHGNQIDLDLKNTASSSNEEVTLSRGGSVIKADKFEASNDSNVMRFEGHVTTHIKLTDF
ncbi:MAG: LPS export ABC transporter periplasmic protein LptC [Pseudomonadota bacterium]